MHRGKQDTFVIYFILRNDIENLCGYHQIAKIDEKSNKLLLGHFLSHISFIESTGNNDIFFKINSP